MRVPSPRLRHLSRMVGSVISGGQASICAVAGGICAGGVWTGGVARARRSRGALWSCLYQLSLLPNRRMFYIHSMCDQTSYCRMDYLDAHRRFRATLVWDRTV